MQVLRTFTVPLIDLGLNSRGTVHAPLRVMNRRELENRSAAFAKSIFRFCVSVRTRVGGSDPADQLQRASSSAAANYRASGRSRSPKEFVSKLGTVNEESDEAVYWLEYVRDNRLASESDIAPLYQEAKELRAIFAASYATARRNEEERQRKLRGRRGALNDRDDERN